MTTYMRVALVAALLLTSCASLRPGMRPLDRKALERWTRHYEKKLGTARHEIRFVELGEGEGLGPCAFSYRDGFKEYDTEGSLVTVPGRAVVYYDMECWHGSTWYGRKITERGLALHEVLHEYAGHHRDGLELSCAEPEVLYLERIKR